MDLRLQDLSDGEFQTMHTAVLDLLSGYGVRFEDQAALDLLVRAGNPADSQGRVHLAPEFVESMLGLVPPHGFLMYGRDEAKVLRVAVDAVGFRPATGAPNVFDYGMRARRKASMGDIRELVTLADALDGFDMVNAVVTPEEAPGGAANVLGFVESHRFSLKPSDVTVMTAQEVRAIGQISAAIRGSEAQLRERPLTAIDVAMISPLRCAAEQSQCLLECARRGLPIEVLTAPAMGLTAPITLAGSAALAIAEVVAALCLVYLVEPGLGIINTARVQPVNMRTTAVNYGAPELGMASVLVAACCARYHLPCNLYGFGSTAGRPGIQATMERTLSGLLMALGHAHMITGSGLLHNGLVTSPEQLVIDDEVIRFLKRIQRPIPIAEESLGIGALIEGMAGSGTMVAEEHTLRHLRAGEMHQAGLGQWTLGAQGDALDLLDLAHTRVEEILASHTVAPFDARTEARIEGIMDSWAG